MSEYCVWIIGGKLRLGEAKTRLEDTECGKPASVKTHGVWLCEKHADIAYGYEVIEGEPEEDA